jgi:CxxC motif-containing protein
MSDRINEKKFTCIICPLGCEVTVKLDAGGNIIETMGQKCPKGEKYATDELKYPKRVLTSTVPIEGALHARLPVKTSSPIPKDKIFDCKREIEKIRVKTPVRIGDVLIKNVLALGADVAATRDLG